MLKSNKYFINDDQSESNIKWKLRRMIATLKAAHYKTKLIFSTPQILPKKYNVAVCAIFKNIKENCNLLTSQDIKKVIAELYKTNVSAFVVAMKKKSLEEILLLLQEADINIGKGKVTFLKNILIEHQTFSIDETNEINNLDYEYYKQVQTELGYMQKSKDYQQTAVSKIITLTALVSIVKANRKKEKETQKGELL